MSTLISLTEVSTQLLTTDPGVLASSTGGILDWVDDKSAQATNTIRNVVIVVALLMIAITAVVTKMAFAKLIATGLAAGFFIWLVFNIDWVQNLVGNEIGAGEVVTTSTLAAPPAHDAGTPLVVQI